MKIEDLIHKIILDDQFQRNQKEKEELLVGILKEQLKNNEVNANLKKFHKTFAPDISAITKLSQIPFLPVNMFKEFDLITCDEKNIVRVLNSSSTTSGRPSKIYLDKITSARQSQALISTLKGFLGIERKPLLVIDGKQANSKADVLTARGAAIRGFSTFASKLVYVLDNEEEDLILNFDRLKEFENKYKDHDILVYGFTYIIWSKFVNVLREKGIRLCLPKMKLLHSGGWKKLTSQKVSKDVFTKITAETFGTLPENIIDFYGMVEQLGVVFLDCECGHKHVADFADIIIRDFNTLEEVKFGQCGLIEVISTLGSSYPSQGILTEDIGEFLGMDDCKCGRKGKYFKFISRVEKAETRGCGDTFAEKELVI